MTARNRGHVSVLLVVFCCVSLSLSAFDGPDEQTSTVCTFEDGKEISIRYAAVSADQRLPKSGVWTPGGSPMFLFSQTGLVLDGSQIALGAYSLYLIPGDKNWTLIVNKNVSAGSNYDAKQDIAQTSMETAKLGHPVDRLNVVFVKAGPKECNLRIYFGKIGTYGAAFKEAGE